jgi:PRTRC genetic system protein A
MKIANAIMAESSELPPIGEAMYQYVVAGNGLFIRAEDSRIEACVPIADAELNGLAEIEPYARLKVERVPGVWLLSMLNSARLHMPQEAMYQLHWSGVQNKAVLRTWRCSMPTQASTPTAVRFIDDGEAVVDVHSHNSMPAFFSATDDDDEQGLRFYVVIGRIDTATPEIRVRVGVYGHHMDVPGDMIFDDLGPFTDRLGEDETDLIRLGEDETDLIGTPVSEALSDANRY